MMSLRIAQRYARVIFDCARDAGVLEVARSDLQSLDRMIRGSVPLQDCLQHGNLSAPRQQRAVAALFEGRVDPLVYRFLRFLARKRRLDLVSGICMEFGALYDRFQGIVRAKLTTAYPLDRPQMDAIATLVPRQAGGRVEIETVQDATLRGGFYLQVGDTLYDYSVGGQVQRMRRMFMAATG